MSHGINYLHSHSGLERTLHKDKDLERKSYVLVDEKFKSTFSNISSLLKRFEHNDRVYFKVPIMSFVRKGGVFKNLYE